MANKQEMDQRQALEKASLENIVNAFRTYALEGDLDVRRWEASYERLPSRHKDLLSHLPGKYGEVRRHLALNQSFLHDMLYGTGWPLPGDKEGAARKIFFSSAKRSSASDVGKVRYVLKDLAREWSAEGAVERAQSFGRITDALAKCFPERKGREKARVLVPGCGLARLVLDVAAMGFNVEGNEFSYYMLLTSAFMMNCVTQRDQWTVYPWVLGSCNNRSDQDQCRPVPIPDVCPEELNITSEQMSVCGGDFTEVYKTADHAGKWDCVVTCFFMDTAHNVIEYIEVIRNCLKEGGLWINLGLALWHWADSHTYLSEDEMSVELSWEDVENVASKCGFEVEMREMVPCRYTSNVRSMMQTEYNCDFSLRRKKSAKDNL